MPIKPRFSCEDCAILPITGIILPVESQLSALLGATTLDRFTHDFQQALENPAISRLLLYVDSPGGAVTGVHAAADLIYHARGQKPITAYIAGMGASAAYWLASAADELVLDPTASVGSIGVLSIHTDTKAQKAQQGVIQTEIVSRQSPYKCLDIQTEAGRANVQAQVDAIAEVFVSKVARNRNVSVETVLSDFGQGRLLVGRQAIQQGLADRLGGWIPLLQEKTAVPFPSTQPTGVKPMTTVTNPEVPLLTVTVDLAYLRTHHADLLHTVMQEGAAQERARIEAVENQCLAGHEALIRTLKFDGKTTAKEAAFHVLSAEKANRDQKRAKVETYQFPPLPIVGNLEELGLQPMSSKARSPQEQWQLDWDNDPALRAEFGTLNTYLAFQKAQANGQC